MLLTESAITRTYKVKYLPIALLFMCGSLYGQATSIPTVAADIVQQADQVSNVYYRAEGDDGDVFDSVTNDVRYDFSLLDGATFNGNVKFAPADINTGTDTITPATSFDSRFVTGIAVQYDAVTTGVAVSGVAPTGITDEDYYWINVSGSDITLHPTRTDAVNGTNKANFTDQGSGTAHWLNRGCSTYDNVWVDAVDITTGTDVFAIDDHGFETGAQVWWVGGGSGTPGGMTATTNIADLWVYAINDDSFTLHPSYADAVANTNTQDITSAESGRLARGRSIQGIRMFAENPIVSGGTIDARYPPDGDQYELKRANEEYCNSSNLIADYNTLPQVKIFEGVRVMNSWDGLKPTGTNCSVNDPSTCNPIIRDSWVSDNRDDAIENDGYGSLEINNTLIERTFVCVSMNGSGGAAPSVDQSVTDSIDMTNFFCELSSKSLSVYPDDLMEYHGAPMKLNASANVPLWNCTNCVWAFEQYNDDFSATAWDRGWDKADTVTDSYILYLGGDTLPTDWPNPTGSPWNISGFTVLTGQAAKQKWRETREQFIADHPYLYNGDSSLIGPY